MGFFDIDFDKTIWENIPVDERTPIGYAWLKVLSASPKYTYSLFMANRASNLYRLLHTGQVCYLEAVLNDTFDNTLRRIFITDDSFCDPDWWALDSELEPDWWALDSEAAPVLWPLDTEEVLSESGFVVHVPAGLVYDANRMKALIDLYRLASKNDYTIVSP